MNPYAFTRHALLSLLLTALSLTAAGAAGQADLVVLGPIRTMADSTPLVHGMAVQAGKIIYIGSAEEARSQLAPDGTLITLKDGESLLPGFVDSHIHMLDAGMLRRTCMMEEPKSKEQVLAIVAAYAKKYPQLEWITGSGWPPSVFADGNPHKVDLDTIVPDRPVFLYADDGHSAWANSLALQHLGITKDTPDPPRGRIERDPKTGEPTGTLREDAAFEAEARLPKPSDDFMFAALDEAQAYLHSLGITSVQDAYSSLRVLEIYSRAAHSGKLTMKVVAAQIADAGQPVSQVDEMIRRRDRFSYGHLRADSVKVMMDGIMEGKTAAVLQPYEGTHDYGILNWPREKFAELATRLDRDGFQIHVHAIGDAATRAALDGIAAARHAHGPSANRHHIAHLELIDPADFPRFKELDVTANLQPYWMYADVWLDNNTLPYLGPERSARLYQMGTLLNHGARLALGSDWPVSTPNPFLGITVGVTRQNPNKPGTPAWLPAERVPLETLLRAYTLGGAWINRSEKDTGSLEVGKAADFIIVDRDIVKVPITQVATAAVLATYIDGKKVFQREPGTALETPSPRQSFAKAHYLCPCREHTAETQIRFLKTNPRLTQALTRQP